MAPARKCFTPEQFTAEHRAVQRAADEFFAREVQPNLDAILAQDFKVLKQVLRKAAALGLVSTLIPEAYGGSEMDLVSTLIITESIARDGSYAMCHGAQSGIGALPLVLFGSEDQKRRYLPKLASAEMIPAYCLTEAQSGSDALHVRTTAMLSPDGTHYILNGQKMWITNGGIADLHTVFANVSSAESATGFTAFLVERGWNGVRPGPEEKKMGLNGSSTTAVYFDDVRVPVENVLGEVGRGHKIALNVLNLGRLKIGAYSVGKSRSVLKESIAYTQSREAFGKPIAEFGLIQEKLARMATRIFVTESMTYRLAGMIQDQMSADPSQDTASLARGSEEFAAECALVKIFASETLGYVTDEAVQIHGGYGYHKDYAVERAYRDARIYRIFEGTNEINRLAAVTILLKRARKGMLPLADAAKSLDPEPSSSVSGNVRKLALLLFGAAYHAYGGAIEDEQEVTAAIADVLMNLFALESAELRAPQAKGQLRSHHDDMMQLFAAQTLDHARSRARSLLAACGLPHLTAQLRQADALVSGVAVDTIQLQRNIAAHLVR